MIRERFNILEVMKFWLINSIKSAHIRMYKNLFIRMCKANRIAFKEHYMILIAEIML